MYEYKHSLQDRAVYRYPAEPTVIEQRDKKGKRTGWHASMEVEITRADNVLTMNRWKYPVSSHPVQQFKPDYKREEVVSYFLAHHAPRGDEITGAEYMVLQAAYAQEANTNRESR